MAQEMETIMNQALSEGWNIGAVITDNAGQCGRARRILTLRWPGITFLFCFAHCVNTIVKAVLKSTFSDVAKEATAAVKCINASSAKWLVEARKMMKECYGKPLALFTLCETRWNSIQSCFASLLRVRTSLEMLSSKFRAKKDFPSSLKVFSDPVFWRKLSEAEHVIAPLSEASYRLQRDENTLTDVVVSFRDIILGFNECYLDCRSGLIKCVEDCWQQCEQPLFMLALLLNPATADEGRELIEITDERKRVVEVEERLIGGVLNERIGLTELEKRQQLRDSKRAAKIASSTQLAKFAVYYYRRLIGDDFDCIRMDLMEWIENTLTSCHPKEFRFDKVRFWQHIKKENPTSVLPDLAIRILSIAVNTATTERLFSEIGMIHTPHRNKMSSPKVLDSQCIRQHLRDSEQKAAQAEPTLSRILDPTERPLVGSATPNELHTELNYSPESGGAEDEFSATPSRAETLPPRTHQLRLQAETPIQQTPRTPIRRSPRQQTPTSQTPIRRSSRRMTPTSQAPEVIEQATHEDDLDDISDGVDGEETFPRWQEYFDEVFDDDEIGSEFTTSHDDDSNWEFEEIPPPDDTPFPDVDNALFPHEKKISGIRALKAPLAALFTTTSSTY